MKNLRDNIWNKRIPQIYGLFFLVLSTVTIFWLSGNMILFGTKAAAGSTPKNVKISNISDTSFTVSYITDDKVVGSVVYGKDTKLGNVALDDRDQQLGQPIPNRVHHISVQRLSPSAKYYFSIVSGTITYNNGSSPYEVSTASLSQVIPSAQPPVVGQVSLEGGDVPTEGIAYISADSSQLLSVLVKPDGSYFIPMNSLRKKDLSGNYAFTSGTVLHLLITDPTSQSNVSVLATKSNPVPAILLSKDYDFAISNLPLSPTKVASESAERWNFSTAEDTEPSTPKILVPKDNEKVTSQKPLFSGKAIPNETVDILIESENDVTASVKADGTGNWQFSPLTPLAFGQHTLTIKTKDASGIIQTLTRSFTVYASGSRFVEPSVAPNGSSSDSATLTPTNTPVPTEVPTVVPTANVPTPTNVPTPVSNLPTLMPLPSTTDQTIPSVSPVPSLSIYPSSPSTVVTNPPIPNSGNSSLFIGIIATGLTVGIGAILFILTLGGL